jgi:hypothetical protein
MAITNLQQDMLVPASTLQSPLASALTPLGLPQGETSLLAVGNKEALFLDVTQYPVSDDLFAKTSEQLLL